jgi:hypothetical protein
MRNSLILIFLCSRGILRTTVWMQRLTGRYSHVQKAGAECGNEGARGQLVMRADPG